ncbi:ATP-dependent DNA helicase RecQ [Qipengyuania citrea LAMA 915]|uniref:ATP-dependent DNA helicase RecQ n=1 Tax=Qipengyuania citrea LAMA 915 TaxID=1306953 RepID=A0A0L1KGC0_9SPHN|nr:protein DpdF [Qipengyuania citrea]KNH02926.1 ATP-dependent DNA helicase RecQ [Qipengyuania citrea LAMA 915]
MSHLSGAAAFEALARLLAESSTIKVDWTAAEPAFERLRAALVASPQQASVRDLQVLLRQALWYEKARRGDNSSHPEAIINHPAFAGANWVATGLRALAAAKGWRVHVEAWLPTWLGGPTESVEWFAAAEFPCRFGEGSGVAGDPFLAAVNRQSYRSTGQRAAARAALTTPPGSTLAVGLATGEGKSLLFQLAQVVGFSGDAPRGGVPGTTLVIVPTVALALDHEASSLDLTEHRAPLAYRSGAESNVLLTDRIREGSQGLCFASPEAACGPLRGALLVAAKMGYLRALIIDEAHLVDQWGTSFRTEFQELSGLRRELIAAAPQDAGPRTLLLSATLTESSLATLETLFGDGGPIRSLAAVNLRPEPDYWIATPCTANEREQRVLEALAHVPRPAILYVTEVKHAKAWQRIVREAGYRRVRMLHGGTSASEREQILKLWRDGALDLVIGTSAFGLGIDYQHARTILHACVPETLDRFYQEVGRAGRDGRASLSLALPAFEDFGPAERLGEQKVISVDRGMVRWTSMFESAVPVGEGLVAVNVDARPSVAEDDIDMRGARNTDWNVRTLTLLARAGMVELVGRPPTASEKGPTRLAIRILDDGHQRPDWWAERVAPVREGIAKASRRNFDLMRRFLRADECPARVFEALYGAENVLSSCSRCRLCRADPTYRGNASAPREPISPWPGRLLQPTLDELIGSGGRLLVADDPNMRDERWHRRFSELLQALTNQGMCKLALIGETGIDEQRAFSRVDHRAFFVGRSATLVGTSLPPGPELVLVGRGVRLNKANLRRRETGNERIFMLPPNLAAPDKPDLALTEIFDGSQLSFDQFYGRLTA